MKKIFRKEVLIGAIVIFALALLFFGIDFLKGVNVFKASNYYTASYNNVEGLAISAPVTINGFKVGQVREIRYQYDNPGHVLVEMSVDKSLKVPTGSEAVLKTDLLGTASIEIKMSQASTMHNVGDELKGVVATGLMDNVSKSLLPSVESFLPKIDTLLTSINRIVDDPALLTAVRRIDDITVNLEATTRQLKAVMSKMSPIANNVETITGNFAQSSEDLTVLTEKLERMPVDTMAEDLAAIVVNLRTLTEQLNEAESTVGKLTHDPQLYDNINATVRSLDSLFIDIKKNPKRYISIKLL